MCFRSERTGGYLIPENVVASINEQASPRRGVIDLFAVINGVRGSAVDVPFENETLTRAQIALPGATKENANGVWGGYAATLFTLAKIFDVGNQLLRHSQGAAEQSIRSRLARAFALGEDHYILNGSGTNQPYGLPTALTNSSAAYTSTFSTPADNTVAGSVMAALATAAGALEGRGAVADSAVMNTTDYWRMRRQGTDEAGFFIDPSQPAGRDLSLFGIRLRHYPNLATDNLVVGEFSSTEIFRGDSYRVDTSSEAGDRWTKT